MLSERWEMLLGGVFVRDLRAKEDEGYAWREASEIERIVIHHVGPPGGNRDYTAGEIDDYHAKVLGWPGIGYHFLAHPDGRLEYVGDILTARYHVGKINRISLGICLAGDFTREAPTRVQLSRVKQLVGGIRRELGRQVEVFGHTDVSHLTGYGPTACPGRTWPLWKAGVLAR